MKTMGVRRRVGSWRAQADLVEATMTRMPKEMQERARGYAEAMRECAAQLEHTIEWATRPGVER